MAIPGFGEIAEQLRRSTVLIHSGGRGAGSGVIWSSDGVVVTNAHVIRGSRVNVQLWDGREFEAAIRSRDPRRDLAQLRIDAENLPAASAADSSAVRPGELAIAIGNPMGFVGALATGVIHAVGPLRGLGRQAWVQADVRLAPGNSGGPLANAHGRIIGINTMVAGRLALAIPSNAVRDFLSAGPANAWLGVTVHPALIPRPAGAGKTFGLVVLEVEPGSPADLASLMPGDILLGTEDKGFRGHRGSVGRSSGQRSTGLAYRISARRLLENSPSRGAAWNPVAGKEPCGGVIRVFIVAASPLARAGLENLLAARDVEVVASNGTIDALAEMLADAAPDVVLIDSSGEPFEPVLESILASGLASDVSVVIIGDGMTPAASADALRAGIRAALPGDISPDQLVAALQAVASGLLVLHPSQHE